MDKDSGFKLSRGFSLVEILVAFGLLAGLSLYVGRLGLQMTESTSRMEAKFEEGLFLNQFQQVLNNPSSCTRTFGNYCSGSVGSSLTEASCSANFEHDNQFNFRNKKTSYGLNYFTNKQDIKDNSLALQKIYLNEVVTLLNLRCNVRYTQTPTGHKNKLFSFIQKQFTPPISWGSSPFNFLDQIVNTNLLKDNYLSIKQSCPGNIFGDEIFINGIYVSVNDDVQTIPSSYNLTRSSWFSLADKNNFNNQIPRRECPSNFTPENHGTFSPLNNNPPPPINPHDGSVLKYSCIDYEQSTVGKISFLIFYLDYSFLFEMKKGIRKSYSKKFFVPFEPLPVINENGNKTIAEISGTSRNDIYVGRCGSFLSQPVVLDDFISALWVSP
ncbi:MAG: hypothetical protein CME61_06870 [Halobacteriovoraceae bacterium]|nr:hypothetical protein [Halobacteriovoraceae bacterium]